MSGLSCDSYRAGIRQEEKDMYAAPTHPWIALRRPLSAGMTIQTKPSGRVATCPYPRACPCPYAFGRTAASSTAGWISAKE